MTRTIDSHQHFWSVARNDYGWLTPELRGLYRDFGPVDLEPHLKAACIDATVLVQAAPTEAETRYLLDIANATSYVSAVVGWVDLAAPDAPDRIATLAVDGMLRGIRPMLQNLPDPAWILGKQLKPALKAMAELNLCFDALVKPVHLQPLLTFSGQNPDLRVVIDHGAKPDIRSGDMKVWARELRILAHESPVHCKLSGLVTEAHADWQTRDLEYCVHHIVECFGPDRIMWGSDWPVVELAGGYRRWHEAANDCLRELSIDERAWIFGSNAARFYGLARAG